MRSVDGLCRDYRAALELIRDRHANNNSLFDRLIERRLRPRASRNDAPERHSITKSQPGISHSGRTRAKKRVSCTRARVCAA